MTFAAHKTQVMTISRRRDRDDGVFGALHMNGTELDEVNHLKLLGVDINCEGSAKLHVKQKAETAAKLVGMLRRQSPFLSEEARYHVYASCIRPIIDYCGPIFANAPVGSLRLLDRIQDRAARLFPTQVSRLDCLALRRDVAGLCQLHRIVHGTAPPMVMSHMGVEPLRTTRTTRQSESSLGALQIPRSRSTFHKNSFLPYYIRIWNRLPERIVFQETLQAFKRMTAEFLRTSQPAYAHGHSNR